MAAQVLILVNGIPATGKTTLSRKLARDLNVPCIGKDDIKELLFDRMGSADIQWSKDHGGATADMVFVLIERLLDAGRSFMVENAFYQSFARPRISAMLESRNVTCLEIYCTADQEVRIARFKARNESGERHPGHVDHNYYTTLEDVDETVKRYAPLDIGPRITVDTTSFGDEDYATLVAQVKKTLGQAITTEGTI